MTTIRENVVINEVGLRDGLQNQPRFVSTDDKLRLAEALRHAGVRHMEATSFVSPKAVPQMADAAELFSRLPEAESINYSVLIPNMKGYERALKAGARSVAAVLSCTDTMNRRNINMSLDETLAVTREIVASAARDGVAARVYLAVAFECPYEGPVALERVMTLAEQSADAGSCEIVIADTIGAANPIAVDRMFSRLGNAFERERLSGHFHDTRGLACANVFAALQTGIRKFDASIGGLGGCPFAPGAAGNAATEDLVHFLEAGGYSTGIDLERLSDAVAVAESCTGVTLGGHWLKWKRSRAKPSGSAPQR